LCFWLSRSIDTCSFICSAGKFSIVLGSYQESDCQQCPDTTTSVPGSSACVCQPGVALGHKVKKRTHCAASCSPAPALSIGRNHISTTCCSSAAKSLESLESHCCCPADALHVWGLGTPPTRVCSLHVHTPRVHWAAVRGVQRRHLQGRDGGSGVHSVPGFLELGRSIHGADRLHLPEGRHGPQRLSP
jgi:hypothetical protein